MRYELFGSCRVSDEKGSRPVMAPSTARRLRRPLRLFDFPIDLHTDMAAGLTAKKLQNSAHAVFARSNA